MHDWERLAALKPVKLKCSKAIRLLKLKKEINKQKKHLSVQAESLLQWDPSVIIDSECYQRICSETLIILTD